ncbi:MAG: T9SS type A sorting domain-containing protein [Ignavibacteria bacterium]|nr:T9SS type A sorting domain-containing protein [Ignavibacteria bacterium]
MKNLLLVLLHFIIVSSFISNSYSWDSEAAKFYPLAVGNQWSYHRVDRTGFNCIQISNEYNYIVTVVTDTLMPNGKRYFKLQGPSVSFERIDSVTMNVYKYSGSGECLIDSLFARLNNIFNSCRQLNNAGQFQVQDTNSIVFLNESRRVKNIRGNLLIGHQYILMYGMGLYRESACENGGAIITLNGCIINNVLYGAMLGIVKTGELQPDKFSLSQNFPNPFNPATKIKFAVSGTSATQTTLAVYNVLGHEVSVLVSQQLQPGTYEADWDASAYPSGVYYYKLDVDPSNLETSQASSGRGFTETKKMVLIK